MIESWGPFAITIAYTVVAVILGYRAKGSLDMNRVENWSSSGNTLGIIVMIFLTGAGNVSAYTFLGAPGWGFSRGTACLYVVVYMAFIVYAQYLATPRITKIALEHGYRTQAEGIGARFESKFLRYLCAIVGFIAVIGNSMVQIIGSGNIIFVMSRGVIPLWLGELIIVTAISIYVYRSGLRAIGWTNVLQGVMMLCLSLIVCLFVLYTAIGGFSITEAFARLAAESPAHLTLPGAMDNFPPIYWSTSIIISIFSFWPQYWVWASGAKDEETARQQYRYLPVFYFVMIPMMIVGLVCVFAYSEFDGASDQVALTYCLEKLPWWLSGLLGAGILAASQSSAEPQLHTSTFTITHDFIAPVAKMTPEKEGRFQRKMLLVVIFCVAFPLSVTNPSELVNILLVAYGFVGQLFPCMLGLLCWPRGTKAGAVAGLAAGVLVVALFNIVWPNPLYVHAGIWGLAVNLPVFIIVSLFTKPASEETLRKFFPAYIMDQLYVEVEK